ncbi:alpha/beta fold hydrolase [Sphingobium vermicomposti]|uniref:Pimeloyl-ACP methyl ester carboxylesterase n=1 Tax=Sphingobium vermicomposti TaxID=529005 RepID=A0A846M9K7_9SPHN|nr:pimeloyl-ACP methyl ester carboxylesterase [Sphingobium vermicomposti]
MKRRLLNRRMPLSYAEWPHEGAPLAILVHGSRDHSRSWDALAAALHPDYHVIAPDLRGHGDSGWSQDGRYDFAAYLSDLAVLIEQLELGSQRQAILIGHSLGAHIALRFSGIYPEKVQRIVAIEAVGAPPAIEVQRLSQSIEQTTRNWLEERHEASLAAPRIFASIDEAIDRMRGRHGFLTPAQARHLTRHGLQRAGKAGWQWKHDPYLAVWAFPDISMDDARALWRNIACPALLLYGERSWPSGLPADLLRHIPDVREVRLPDSGHWPQHDAFGPCLSAIKAFLAK